MLGVFNQRETMCCNMRVQERAPANTLLMDRTIKEWNNKKQNDERSVGYKMWEDMLELLDDAAWEIEGYSVNLPREVLAKVFRVATLPIVVATAVPAIACEVAAKVQQE